MPCAVFSWQPDGSLGRGATLAKSARDRIYRWRIHGGSCDNLAAR